MTVNLADSKLLKENPPTNLQLTFESEMTEVLKSRTSNPVSLEPPGPRAQATRRLWGPECF